MMATPIYIYHTAHLGCKIIVPGDAVPEDRWMLGDRGQQVILGAERDQAHDAGEWLVTAFQTVGSVAKQDLSVIRALFRPAH